MEDTNEVKNRSHYENLYNGFNVNNVLYWINHLDDFLEKSIATETSWHGLYKYDLQKKLEGKEVLELGCGNCINAAIMAALGARVYANDLASVSGEIIKKLNKSYDFKFPIKFIEGDFLKSSFESKSFDYIVGKAFLHHLTIPVENLFLAESARLLKPNGEARFFEPAVNSKILDEIRWYLPIGKRPSKFNKMAFKKWKDQDPHPERTLSSRHFQKLGDEYFNEVEIIPVGSLERFGRLMKWGEARNKFRRNALRAEVYLPSFVNRPITRSQLIIYRKPKVNI